MILRVGLESIARDIKCIPDGGRKGAGVTVTEEGRDQIGYVCLARILCQRPCLRQTNILNGSNFRMSK
jgi:hypothetical protein